MIVVTGAPRSGTSLMMRLMGEALGWDRVLAVKYPAGNPYKTGERLEALRRRYGADVDIDLDAMERWSMETNPNGFWEMPVWVMTGIPDDAPWFPEDCITKLTGSALLSTDPNRVDHIVYMVRDPRTQHKSVNTVPTGVSTHDPTPTDWLMHNRCVCEFASRYNKPTSVVVLEHLRQEPISAIALLSATLGGQWKADMVEPWSGGPESPWPDHPDWQCAKKAYGMLCSDENQFRDVAALIERNRNAQAIAELTPEERALIGV